ncbi:disulfide bond formation protein B [Roseomonas sp. NAR14]|uniref:Disulfide bond formation protein B n=1 Tax=Roseomonas acroporae TaxID=2937791 RepID=A0A9X1Y903_9PROT|nr:disulfide bond formation protein B [Roseomonas acroporae]MCK8786349.1 disulfide bond formation protein B [Roseomonas acroporae]
MLAPLLIAALAAAAPLFAHASEGWWGLAPCELCLWQRWPYWAAAALALLGLVLPRRPMLLLAAVAVLASGAVGAFHVGVEQGWWPSPLAGCQAPRGSGGTASVEDLLRDMPLVPSKPCDAPTYLIPGLPLSMAGMNVIYALGVAGLAFGLARRKEAS